MCDAVTWHATCDNSQRNLTSEPQQHSLTATAVTVDTR